jgi:hypothetical protein
MMKQNPNWMDEAKRTGCGKTPIHITKTYQTMPYMAVLPSDMGFPILIESHHTNVISMKGEFEVDCSSPGLPALALKSSKKMAYSWSGYAGIVSPFGDELLAAGVDSHRALNFPIKTVIRVNPKTTSVDFRHFHVIPFTTKSLWCGSNMTPIVADNSSEQMSQSRKSEATRKCSKLSRSYV